jgi:3',5'-cyclic AMP phosphodiesterase CpdA
MAKLLGEPVSHLGYPVEFAVWQLSDIHFGKLNKTEPDPRELAMQIGKIALDYPNVAPQIVVVSGDVSSVAAADEFETFHKFCGHLSQALWDKECPERVLVVPGNHDVSWQSDGTADQMKGFVDGVAKKGACITPFGGAAETFSSGNISVRRLDPRPGTVPPMALVKFGDYDLEVVLMVSGYFSGAVPKEVQKALAALPVSVDALRDLLRRDEGAVNREYLFNLAKLPKREAGLRVGVIHHNPIQYGIEVCANKFAPQLLESLYTKEATILLHGHVHLVEDAGGFRPVGDKQAYPIPCPTLCSEAIAGGKGLAIHLLGRNGTKRTFDTLIWQMSASSGFREEGVALSYRLNVEAGRVART